MTLMYCVGCGLPVGEAEPGKMLAVSCPCGAMAPILHSPDGRWAPPASFIRATGVMTPHIEYYLGFSEHKSALKTELTRMLRALGSISYTECTDAHCRESWDRSKREYQVRLKAQTEHWDWAKLQEELEHLADERDRKLDAEKESENASKDSED